MLTKKMNEALNEQVKWELYSSYLYLSMAAWCADIGLGGVARWMRAQAQEEDFHGKKFYDYILERGGKVRLLAIDQPPHEWKDVIDLFEETLKHERAVTARINALVDVAMEERDHATNIFLQWFVSEQVEEEDNVNDVLAKLRLIGGRGEGLFYLDKELGMRVFTPPVPAE
ncbi:MAG: ferritin [Desulfovibrionaceae bacterium]|jgi:ferritin|nr:ferritin [Desulfovibrionaceae bacterium]